MNLQQYRWFLVGIVVAAITGWIVFPAALYERIEQPLQFSHNVHIGEAVGMSCTDCHQMNAGERGAAIPAVSKCAECHSEAIGTTEAELKLVEDYIKTEREIPWLVYSQQPQNVHFSHIAHTGRANIRCEECHGPHGESESLRPFERNRISGYSRDIWGSSITRVGNAPWEGKKMDDCADCHTKRGVVNSCLKCHQ
ncbi:MAG: cytochrome c family protein [Bacteroidetes bacterium]|nr:cytochrome c family protein [Bacteroidota bacterium]